MNTATNSTASSATGEPFALPHGAPAAARTAFKLLSRLKYGTLTLQLPDGSMQRFGSGDGPTASLRLVNWNVCSASLRSGDIGFAPDRTVAGTDRQSQRS
jgi:cyclopropane-fatty-acyl-phospholipid synthase